MVVTLRACLLACVRSGENGHASLDAAETDERAEDEDDVGELADNVDDEDESVSILSKLDLEE